MSEVTTDDLIHAFNLAYRNYYTPITMNRMLIQSLQERDAVDLGKSVVAVEDGQVIGTSFIGLRPPDGWIGGVGVIPTYRRHGAARQMLRYQIDHAPDYDLTSLRLEVVEQNTGAITLYEQLGFVATRRMFMLERDYGGDLPLVPNGYQIDLCHPLKALKFYNAFHDTDNSWQRNRSALEKMAESLQGFMVHCGDYRPIGYAVGWFHFDYNHLMDVAIDPTCGDRTEAAHALLIHLHSHPEPPAGYIFNVAEHDFLITAFRDIGYYPSLAQWEMHLPLNKPDNDL